MLDAVPGAMRQSMTFDNGPEFALHYHLADQTGIQTYFCDVRSPWQKGGVENAIGRLRRSLPRKTNLDDIGQAAILQAAHRYNHTPRKCLDFLTPAEAFSRFQSTVALQT